jgi:orotidine-5'-phosphate decarboxylase
MNPLAPLPSLLDTKLPVAIALDNPDLNLCLSKVDLLHPWRCRLKVGKALFTHAGPKVVDMLQHRGFDVFLDLKYHDIPETVAQASRAAADLGVWMFNIHALGGKHMMAASRAALNHYTRPPKLIAVTLLTSIDDTYLQQMSIANNLSLTEYVVHLATMAYEEGCDGVVCSAHEVPAIKNACGQDFICVTPGIRPPGSKKNDQKRVMSPQKALMLGSDYLVMGRSILDHPEPMDYLEELCTIPKT